MSITFIGLIIQTQRYKNMITTAHLNWFKLKVPYQANTKEYKVAYSKLYNASYADLNKLCAEFDEYDDGSKPVKHYCIFDEWFATIGDPLTAVNMKGISEHRQKYRVQKRVKGKLKRWTFNSLTDALAKRDAIFGLLATD